MTEQKNVKIKINCLTFSKINVAFQIRDVYRWEFRLIFIKSLMLTNKPIQCIMKCLQE